MPWILKVGKDWIVSKVFGSSQESVHQFGLGQVSQAVV